MDDLLGVSGMHGPPGRATAEDLRKLGVVVPDRNDFARVYNGLHESLAPLVRDDTASGDADENSLLGWFVSDSDRLDRPTDEPARLSGAIQFFVRLLDDWRLSKRDAVGLLGFNPEDSEYVTRLLDGRQKLCGRDISDRIAHLFWIRSSLKALFRDLATENEWLREPHALLDEASPLSLMEGGSMEDLLLVREYVDTLAGR